MNWDQIEGKWKQFKGSFKEKWGKLTDDDLNVIAGKRDQLVGRIQERYGIKREEAQREVDAFVGTISAGDPTGTEQETLRSSGSARRAGKA
jgi:uncharacterized protein YjbJ (UPF0337 family)